MQGLKVGSKLRGSVPESTPRVPKSKDARRWRGEINKRMADPGELVPAGYPVFTLVDIDRMWVAMNLRESQMQGLKVGSKLRGSVPALGQEGEFEVYSSIRPVTMRPGGPPASRPATTSAASRCGCARYAASRASAPA